MAHDAGKFLDHEEEPVGAVELSISFSNSKWSKISCALEGEGLDVDRKVAGDVALAEREETQLSVRPGSFVFADALICN
jgi:hypothetical protein